MTRRHRVSMAVGLLLVSASALVDGQAPAGAPPVPVRGVPVDHSAFDTLLHRHVVDGHVDYVAFARDTSFGSYLSLLDRVDVARLDDAEKLAFWLNVYNAYTIQLVAQSGETESIRNINKTLGFLRLKGPWSTPVVHAAGRTLTLDDVLHNVLRKQFHEPRIHFALVYAAMGSPPLRSEAYHGVRLDAQLDDQGRRFLLESPTQNRREKVQRSVLFVLSPIFTYYRADFGATRAELGRFLLRWMDTSERERIERGAFNAVESTFDWTLNSQAQAIVLARKPVPAPLPSPDARTTRGRPDR